MSKRDQILDAAIELFNRYGIANVRSRDISDYLGISNGNLTYHFPKMDDLMSAVIDRLQMEGGKIIVRIEEDSVSLANYERSLRSMVEVQRRFPFFYKDFLELIRRFPEVGGRYKDFSGKRWVLGRKMIQDLFTHGELHAEPAPGTYDRLQTSMQTTLVFWLTMEELFKGSEAPNPSPVESIMDMLLVYATDGARVRYHDHVKSVN